jgi:D-alanyl-D-alanine carboxypeptidase
MDLRARLATLFMMVLVVCAMSAGRAQAGPTLLLEANSGRVLYAEGPDDQWHPASLTKMMTAYLTFQALKAGKVTLETQIPYSEAAHAQPPSKIGLPVGATMSVNLALQSIIVKSANDISVALAEAIGGTEAQFVEMMNATARRLGMTRTVFRNPHGLPAAEQVSTARDLARLAISVLRDFPEYAHYWGQSQMQVGAVRIVSHNGLFKTLPGVDGMKTGFICDSGYNIVASASRDGVRMMAVVLGENSAADRNLRAHTLIEHGYATMDWKVLFGARETIATLPLSRDAKDAASIRESVVAIECNNRRVARAAAATRKRAKARNRAAAAAKKPAQSKRATETAAPAPAKPGVKGSAKAAATPAVAKSPTTAQAKSSPAGKAAAPASGSAAPR